jgi:hypothetical protein
MVEVYRRDPKALSVALSRPNQHCAERTGWMRALILLSNT